MNKKERLRVLKDYLESGLEVNECVELFKKDYSLDLEGAKISKKIAILSNERIYKLFLNDKIKFTNAIKLAYAIKDEDVKSTISFFLDEFENGSISERILISEVDHVIVLSKKRDSALERELIDFDKHSKNIHVTLSRKSNLTVDFGIVKDIDKLQRILKKIKEIDEISN